MLSDTSVSGGAISRSFQRSLRSVIRRTGVALLSESQTKQNEPTGLRGEYLILFLLVLLAAALRFYKLGEWSYFIDEFHTLDSTWQFFTIPSPVIRPNSRAVFWSL